jgi:hypothetical protein
MIFYTIDPHEAQKIFQAGFRQGEQVAYDPDTRLQRLFPGLRPGTYKIIGSATVQYNCIAWAVGTRDVSWWPGTAPFGYWPPDVAVTETLDAFIQLFRSFGYETCTNSNFERRFEKVAIFVNCLNVTHAARQLGNGRWSSKIGSSELIEHDLGAIAGGIYGDVQQIMQRKRGTPSHDLGGNPLSIISPLPRLINQLLPSICASGSDAYLILTRSASEDSGAIRSLALRVSIACGPPM